MPDMFDPIDMDVRERPEEEEEKKPVMARNLSVESNGGGVEVQILEPEQRIIDLSFPGPARFTRSMKHVKSQEVIGSSCPDVS